MQTLRCPHASLATLDRGHSLVAYHLRTCRFVLPHAFFAHRANVFGRHSGAIVRCTFSLAEEIGK